MSPLRTVIFVDGQNFKKNLQEFRFLPTPTQTHPDTKDYRLDEKHFLWGEFFTDIMKKFSSTTGYEHRLIRTYWYNAESVSPFYIDKKRIQTVISRYQGKMPEINEALIIELAHKWYDREKKNFFECRDRVYDVIQKTVDFIEFKYVGQYKLNPYQVHRFDKDVTTGQYVYFGTREGEKGVDVGIAIDMASKINGFDVAILLSGDADFHPAVRYLKEGLKQVYQFSIAKGIPPNIQYLSPWLKTIVDVFAFFDEEELLGKYLNRKSGIPNRIMDLIDRRIADLGQQRTALAAHH
jgi:uncharacterized LabA/DUF88 family protein